MVVVVSSPGCVDPAPGAVVDGADDEFAGAVVGAAVTGAAVVGAAVDGGAVESD